MAHENLKFKIHVDDQKEWQPIYASQEFGTFYVVYIKFLEVEENYSEKENEIIDYAYNEPKERQKGKISATYKCQFRIQNFRGAISLGFSGDPKMMRIEKSTTNFVDVSEESEFSLEIQIPLMAFHFKEYSEELTFGYSSKIDRSRLLLTKISYDLPSGMYNPKKPIESNYLLPQKYERDGNVAMEIGKRGPGQKKFTVYDDSGMGNRPYGICSPDTSLLY